MRRSLNNDRPTVDRVETIALPEDRVKLRAVLLVLLVLIAVISFAYGINALFTAEPGIREITALTGEMNSGDDFTFYYSLGSGEVSATDEERAVRSLYTQAATDAFQIFSADMEFEGCGNLWYLNQSINEPVAVEPALYNALALLENSGADITTWPLYMSFTSPFSSPRATRRRSILIRTEMRTFAGFTRRPPTSPTIPARWTWSSWGTILCVCVFLKNIWLSRRKTGSPFLWIFFGWRMPLRRITWLRR